MSEIGTTLEQASHNKAFVYIAIGVVLIALYLKFKPTVANGTSGTSGGGLFVNPGVGQTGGTTTGNTGGTTTGGTTTVTSNPITDQLTLQTGIEKLREQGALFDSNLKAKDTTFGVSTNQGIANFNFGLLQRSNAETLATTNKADTEKLSVTAANNAISLTNVANQANEALREQTQNFDFLYGKTASQPTANVIATSANTSTTGGTTGNSIATTDPNAIAPGGPRLPFRTVLQPGQTVVNGKVVQASSGQSRNDILFAASQAPINAQFQRDQTAATNALALKQKGEYYDAQLADYTAKQQFNFQSQLLQLTGSNALNLARQTGGDALALQTEKDRSAEEISANTTGVERKKSTDSLVGNIAGGIFKTIGGFFGF